MEFRKKSQKQFRKRTTEEPDEPETIVNNEQANRQKKSKLEPVLGANFKSSGLKDTVEQNTAFRTLILENNEQEAVENTDGTYKSIKGYNTFINKQKKATQSSNHLKQGPLKGLTQVRISTRFDYAAGICKDYKETGYCGFGDTCIFMHDRSDYKQGWELEQEWNQKQLEKDTIQVESSSEEEVDELPFACLICRKDFKSPVKTQCGHYYCERCAINQFKKSVNCFECGENTNGVFNVAKELVLKLKERNIRLNEKEEELRKMREEMEDSDTDNP